MNTDTKNVQGYTIKEAAELSGLPESTLRYYETIGLMKPINRDSSSKHRRYTEQDIDQAISVACLNAAGMPIEDMRLYLKNRAQGPDSAKEQLALLESHRLRLAQEAHYLQLRQRYIDVKIAYWKAVVVGDSAQIEATSYSAKLITKELKLFKEKLSNLATSPVKEEIAMPYANTDATVKEA